MASYPLELEKSGYRIGHTYKVWSPGTPADAPHGGSARKFQKHGGKFNGFSQFVMKSEDHEKAKTILLEEFVKMFDLFLMQIRTSNSMEMNPFATGSDPPILIANGLQEVEKYFGVSTLIHSKASYLLTCRTYLSCVRTSRTISARSWHLTLHWES